MSNFLESCIEDASSKTKFNFCPLCQAPIHFLKINPSAHVSNCSVDWDNLSECPDGQDCLNTSVFHYRDFAHSKLAAYRSSSYYITPSLGDKFYTSGRKRSPVKSPRKLNASKHKLIKEDCEIKDVHSNDDITNNINKSLKNKNYKKYKFNKANSSNVLKHDSNEEIFKLDCSLNDDEEECDIFKDIKVPSKRPAKSKCDKGNKILAKKAKINNKTKVNSFDKIETNISKLGMEMVLSSENEGIIINKSLSYIEENEMKFSHSINLKESKFQSSNDSISIRNTDKDVLLNNNVLDKIRYVDIKSNSSQTSMQCHNLSDGEEINFNPESDSALLSKSSSSLYGKLHKSKYLDTNFCTVSITEESSDRIKPEDNRIKNQKPIPGVFIPKIESRCKLKREDNSTKFNLKCDDSRYRWNNVHKIICDKQKVSNYKQHKVAKSNYFINYSLINEDRTHKISNSDSISHKVESSKCSEEFNIFSDVNTNVLSKSGISNSKKLQYIVDNAYNKVLVEGSPGKKINDGISSKLNKKDKEIPKLERSNAFTKGRVQRTASIPRRSVKKVCPFYKFIPDTPIVVDAFSYGVIPGIKAYFLTHFHSDHYCGLRKSFDQPIFCSKVTAELIKLKIGVDEKRLNVINCGERRVVQGVEVVAMDANHCPGAVMFLFQLRTGQNYLHVGDFRAGPQMESYPELKQLHIHKLFLDTTYCKPEYDFPTQNTIIEEIVSIVKDELQKNPKTLIVCGAYLIGKEKVFSNIADACNCNIWAEPQKVKILHCLNEPQLIRRLTNNSAEAQVHVLSMFNITFDKLEKYFEKYNHVYTNIVAFRPTGWSHKLSGGMIIPRGERKIRIYDVPYSEHSSFAELRRFVQFTRPDEIIPTVNVGSVSSRKEMDSYFKSWLLELKQPKQSSLLSYLTFGGMNSDTCT
ncbi:uncharacterized protein LOC142326088 isoform X2 [Lycorma delicatula]|uniref:uncharacterized protein LOC142326088 isoform X2 n=1 Tax=Lycorma delicatula TaxID=130591 RepID=UPI003F515CB0